MGNKPYQVIGTVGILAGAVFLPLAIAGFDVAAVIALATLGVAFIACMLIALWSF